YGNQDHVTGLMAGHGGYPAVQCGQACSVASGERQQMRFSDQAVGDDAGGRQVPLTDNLFKVIGQEDVVRDLPDLG
ncbi:MAG TPA: hypothetical protein VGI74_06240, partial [Streptosporangiaceae bacterium]